MGDPLRTPACAALGLDVPVFGAPMAFGPGTPELAAAVSAAGGLGVLPLAGLDAAAAAAQVRRARELAGGRPVGVNVQVPAPRAATTTPEALAPVLGAIRARVGGEGAAPAGTPPVAPPSPASPEDLIAAGLAAGAALVSVALGPAGPAITALAREAGVPLAVSTSTVAEAERAAADGADLLVVQGAEAGGHRTTFDVDAGPLPLVGTLPLVRATVVAVDVPVLAAGGIRDGRGLAAVLALGAQGAWIGTRLMATAEAGTTAAQRALLHRAAPEDRVVTDAVTGRHAQWVRSALVEAFLAGPGHLGPAHAAAARPLVARGSRGGDPDWAGVLAGQGGAGPDGEAAGDVVRAMAAEARAVLVP